jgi:hypothetical protein
MLNFKSFRAAGSVLAGIELIHMIRKASLQSTAPRPCRLPTNFLRWQEWSVQFERCRQDRGNFAV